MLHAATATAHPAYGQGMAGNIIALAQDFSIETTPKQASKVESFAACLPVGTRVFIALIPGEATANMVALAARLVKEGMRPVPHIPARSLEDLAAFESYVRQLHAAGAREALVLAGGLNKPVGDLRDSMELLSTNLFADLGFEKLYVAGHPEGSPDIDKAGLAKALEFKNDYAARSGMDLTITTQFSFDAAKVLKWSNAINQSGNKLPIRIGVAGPASVTNLMKYAKMCGVGASVSMLSKAGGKLFQLVGQSAPDGMICSLAEACAKGETSIANLHYYPFGGFVKNAGWASSVAAGNFVLHPRNSGFTVNS